MSCHSNGKLTIWLISLLRGRELLQVHVEGVCLDAAIFAGVLQDGLKMVVEPEKGIRGAASLIVLLEVGLFLGIGPVVRLFENDKKLACKLR